MKQENDVDVVVRPKPTIEISFTAMSEFTQYLKIKYNGNEDAITKNFDNESNQVFLKGIFSAKYEILNKKSTSLLHKGKPPRADVWENLGRIASEFLKCSTYPKIESVYLSAILNKALGNKDSRVIKDYRNTVLFYCNIDEQAIERCKDSRFGVLDVGCFVSLIPKYYIHTATSTSSLTDANLDEEIKNDTSL